MAGVEAFDLATAKAEPVGNAKNSSVTRRLLQALFLRDREHVLDASHAWPFRVAVWLRFHALRFEPQSREPVTPGASYKAIKGAHAAVDAGGRKPTLKLLCPQCVGYRMRLPVFQGKEM